MAMVKGSADNSRPEPARSDAAGIVMSFLGFLDKHLQDFSQATRDVIGLFVVGLLVIVTMHGVMAPTYVEGRIFVKHAEGEPPEFAKGYMLMRGNEPFTANDNAYFILPVRGFIPQRERIQLKDDAGKYIGEFSFWAPWPVLSAIRPAEYDVTLLAYKASGARIQVSEREPAGFASALSPVVLNAQARVV
jgi:hypothetical protein